MKKTITKKPNTTNKTISKNKTTVHVVAHTHWDREWYFTLKDSDILLTKNLTYLINELETNKDFNAFHYDGQSSLIEDYLTYLPENKVRISKLVKSKKLFIGPWYTQPDLNLSSGESIIRNLQYGISYASDLGHSMNVGYLPDTFGFNNQVPQILKGFEIDNFVFWRGLDLKDVDNNIYFNFTSPNGDSVLALLLRHGYGAGKYLASDERFLNKTKPMIEQMKTMTDIDVILMPSGGDQVIVDKNLPKVVSEINGMDEDNKYVLSSYEDFVLDVKNKIKNKELVNYTDILRSPLLTRIHRTIGSVRMDVKQKLFELENLLVNDLEPLLVYATNFGIDYSEKTLEIIWKKLLSSQAHDSYGSCNSDETNNSIFERLQEGIQMAKGLKTLTIKEIMLSTNELNENTLFIYNQKFTSSKNIVRAIVSSEHENISLELKSKRIDLFIIEKQIISGAKEILVTPQGEKEISKPPYYIFEVYFETNLKPNEVGIYRVIKSENTQEESTDKKFIENDLFKISISKKQLVVLNKKLNKEFKDFITFEVENDAGDQYDFSPNSKYKKVIELGKVDFISSKSTQTISSLKFKATLNIPKDEKSWSKSKKDLEQELIVTVTIINNQIKFNVELENKTRDSRIRILFNSLKSTSNKYVYDNAFGIINGESSFNKNWKEEGYREALVPFNNHHSFIKIENDFNLVLVNGTREHEFVNEKGLYLTLLKTVGFLGKDDLEWRPGRASGINNIAVPTPSGQMQEKRLCFEFNLFFNEKTNPFILVNNSINLINYHHQKWNKFSARLDRFDFSAIKKTKKQINRIELNNNDFVVTSNYIYAGKKYVRLLNVSGKEIKVPSFKNFKMVNLKGNTMNLKVVKPYQLITYEYK